MTGPRAALLVGMGLLTGCSGPSDVVSSRWLRVGHGLVEYQDLADGSNLELVAGPQGGWHVDLAARVRGLEPDGLFLSYRIYDHAHRAQIGYPIKSVLSKHIVTMHERDVFDQVGVQFVFSISYAYRKYFRVIHGNNKL